MKCKACDEILNDKESARKYLHIDEYLDLCDVCLEPIREELVFGPTPYRSKNAYLDDSFGDDS